MNRWVFFLLSLLLCASPAFAEDAGTGAISGLSEAGLYAQAYPDPSMSKYTPAQMKALMNLKPTDLLTEGEKDAFKKARSKRDKSLAGMKDAVRDGKPQEYYRNFKGFIAEGGTIEETATKMKRRLKNARTRLKEDFEPFGEDVKKWPKPAKAENDKLSSGQKFTDNVVKLEDGLDKYCKLRTGDTFETCINTPDTFALNKNFLDTVLQTIESIHEDYRTLLDKISEADRKARAAGKH